MSLSSRNWFRGLAATSAAVVFAVAGGAAALADDISNTIDATVDAEAEVMPLTVGGANGSTTLKLVERNDDGKNGCNLTGSTTLTVSVASSSASIATVSPSSVTFTSCGFTQALTVTPLAAGSTNITLTQTSNNSTGTINLAPAAFKVNVTSAANTAPVVSVTGVDVGGAYDFGAVPLAGCNVTDAEDGSPTIAPSLSLVSGPLASYGLGSQTATCSYTDAGGLTAVSAVTYSIVDKTGPELTLPANITAEAAGPSGTGVTFTSTATDAVGPASPAVICAPASGATFPLGTTTVNCSATDAAGNSATGSFTVTVQDTTAPELTVPANITLEAARPDGATATFQASATDTVTTNPEVSCDPASGPFPLGTTTVSCSATDAAGNEGTASFTVTVQDTTAPTVTVPADFTVEATGPSGATATFQASATDTVTTNPAVSCNPASGSTFPLGETTVHCSATDAAGNEGTGSVIVTVQDTTAPTITWLGGPQDGALYVFGSVPAAGTCTANDLVDTNATCEITGYATTVGGHTLTATATDASGNKATDARDYSVAAWTLKGFYQPVDMNGVWNTVKAGSTVPLKFEVFAGSTEQTSTSAVKGFTAKGVACPSTGAVADDIELTTTGGTSFRYDTTGGQFIQNWQTPKSAGACYVVTMETLDGSKISANFKLK